MKDYYFDELACYKKFKKEKSIPFCKAFIVKSHDEQLDVNMMMDYFAFEHEDAIKYMLSKIEFGPYLGNKAIQDEEIAVIQFTVNAKCLDDIPLLKNMETPPYEKNGVVSATLQDKKWEMSITIYHIEDISVDIGEDGRIQKFTELKLRKG